MDLNSLIAERETVATDAAEVAAPEVAAPVEAAPVVETAAVEAAPDPFAEYGLEPADLAELAELAPMLRQIRDQAGQTPVEEQTGPPEFDPFDPESVHAYNTYRDQQLLGHIQQLMAPLVGQHQSQVMTEAENRATDILKDDQAQHGEFVPSDSDANTRVEKIARAYAEMLLPQFQQRYGPGPRAAEAALTASAQSFRELASIMAEAGATRYKNEMETLAGAPKDIGPGASGTPGAGEFATEMDAAMAYMARNGA